MLCMPSLFLSKFGKQISCITKTKFRVISNISLFIFLCAAAGAGSSREGGQSEMTVFFVVAVMSLHELLPFPPGNTCVLMFVHESGVVSAMGCMYVQA
jgi:hypothetical protein